MSAYALEYHAYILYNIMTPRFFYVPLTLTDYSRSDRSLNNLRQKLQGNTIIETDILNKEGGPPLDRICAWKTQKWKKY